MKPIVLLVFCLLGACAQTLTFLPQAQVRSAVPWSVSVCSANDLELPVGQIYAVMANHATPPLTYSGAVAALTAKQSRSKAARIAQYAGYAAAALSVLMTAKVVQANQTYQQGAQLGSTFFSTLIPLAQHEIPSADGLIAQIARDSDIVRVPAGDCATTMVIGPPGQAFTVALGVPK
jgi:hypothetical protein